MTITGRQLLTGRLKLRPLENRDAGPIMRLIGDWDVIRWLTMPPDPDTRAVAEWFTPDERSRGALALDLRRGVCRCGASGIRLGLLAGQTLFLVHVFDRFGLDAMTAGATADNPASIAVLKKLGIDVTSTRLEPDPVIMYRLSRTRLKANR